MFELLADLAAKGFEITFKQNPLSSDDACWIVMQKGKNKRSKFVPKSVLNLALSNLHVESYLKEMAHEILLTEMKENKNG